MGNEEDNVYGNCSDHDRNQYFTRAPVPMLSVTEVERLCKAGAKLELGPIMVTPDPYPAATPPMYNHLADPMEVAIWDRWKRQRDAKVSRLHEGDFGAMPFRLIAGQYGDKVHVSVYPYNYMYEPIHFEDNAAIFPSDGLMANIALWERHHP